VSRREIREALANAKPNLVDRVVSYFNPVAGAQRLRSRMFMAVAGGYTGGSRSRRQTSEWKVTKNSSADADTLPDLQDLRDRSRDLARNAPLAAGAIAGVVTNVVGTGLALQSRVEREVLGMSEEQAAEWQKLTEREYNLWFESSYCDATRTLDGYGLQGLVFRAALESGDTFVTTPMRKLAGMPYELTLQVFEADQVSNPRLAMDTEKLAGGVELDEFRAPVAYHFRRSHPGALQGVSMDWDRVAAFGTRTGRRQVIHPYTKLRPGQTRGVPYLAPVIETLKMLDRYTEAELMAAVVAGMFTVFVESERGGLDPADPSGIGGETGAQASDKDMKLGAGAIVDLNTGEKISTANPGRPNQAFDGFVDSLCGFVGLALELPKEVLLKSFVSSYSASRAALLEAWKFFRGRRAWLATTFCNPVYEAWMDEAVAKGRIAAPGYFTDPLMRRAYLGAEWVGDGPISVDPVKDVEAAAARVGLGISTRQKESALHDGGDWEKNHEQLAKEEKRRKADGLKAEAPKMLPAPKAPNAPPEGERQPGGADDEGPDRGDTEQREEEADMRAINVTMSPQIQLPESLSLKVTHELPDMKALAESIERGNATNAQLAKSVERSAAGAQEAVRQSVAAGQAMQQSLSAIAAAIAKPRRAVLDKDGNVIGSEPVDKL
jgi:lambda family phage portal protein